MQLTLIKVRCVVCNAGVGERRFLARLDPDRHIPLPLMPDSWTLLSGGNLPFDEGCYSDLKLYLHPTEVVTKSQ